MGPGRGTARLRGGWGAVETPVLVRSLVQRRGGLAQQETAKRRKTMLSAENARPAAASTRSASQEASPRSFSRSRPGMASRSAAAAAARSSAVRGAMRPQAARSSSSVAAKAAAYPSSSRFTSAWPRSSKRRIPVNTSSAAAVQHRASVRATDKEAVLNERLRCVRPPRRRTRPAGTRMRQW